MTEVRKPPKGGKGATLQARISGEMRAALNAEAKRTGRSVSQVAELWLELGVRVAFPSVPQRPLGDFSSVSGGMNNPYVNWPGYSLAGRQS